MWGRLYAPWRASAVWLINPAMEEVLNGMAFGAAPAAGSLPAYMPPGGASVSPYGTLMGRPVIPHQACAAAASKGDIILADFNQYLSVTKTTGMRTDVSIHMYFDTDQVAFRFIMRVGGEPWWDEVITANNGTYHQSGFIVSADGA
jgi:HK97 family phage major capsid protein